MPRPVGISFAAAVPESAAGGFFLRRAGQAVGRGWHWLVVGAALGWLGGLFWEDPPETCRISVEIALKEPAPISSEAGGVPPAETLAGEMKNLIQLASDEAVVSQALARAGLARAVEEVLRHSTLQPSPTGAGLVLRHQTLAAAEGRRFLENWAQETTNALAAQGARRHRERLEAVTRQLETIDATLAALGKELAAQGTDQAQGNAAANPFLLLRKSQDLAGKIRALRDRLTAMDLQIESLRKEMVKFSPALVAAREELQRALTRYTDEHPRVKELRATLADLEKAAATEAEQSLPDAPPGASGPGGMLYSQLVGLRNERIALARELETAQHERGQVEDFLPAAATNSVRQAELEARFGVLGKQRLALVTSRESLSLLPVRPASRFAPTGLPRVETPAALDWRWHLARAGLAALAGLLAVLGLVLGFDLGRGRICSAEDLHHAAQLPVLGTLEDLDQLGAAAQEHWAFQTFTRLKGRLTQSNDEALVCGVISAHEGEGRTTVARLLSEAASRQGYRGVVVSACSGGGSSPAAPADPRAPLEENEAVLVPARLSDVVPENLPAQSEVQLPSMNLTLDLRAQWRAALAQAASQQRLVLIADLPPASTQNGVLLAESLPNLLWVAGRGRTRLSETTAGVNLLKDTRCNLVGAIMNTIPRRPQKKPLRPGRVAALLAALVLPVTALGQPNPPTPPATAAPSNELASLSVSSKPARMAPWQQRLTLGPGDVLNINLHGQKDSIRDGLVVGPDGRINYLEARDVLVTSLTVDELRNRLEEILARVHRSPRVVINPVSYQSKKYYLLGNVNARGVYALDRPTTVIEAVAAAKGFAIEVPPVANQGRAGGGGLVPRDPTGLIPADFSRSFLMRSQEGGGFSPVKADFEGLFLRGDLTQNVLLWPGDYLFFSPVGIQEIYVLGEVKSPGVLPYSQDVSVLSAVLSRGGFTSRASKGSVVVVRGSLTKPVGTVINVNYILSARAPDFPLQNRDIIYVSQRPFAKVEELVEAAVLDFTRAVVIGWAGKAIVPTLSF
jgi:protein involved in polysaccharide export with SLBB domain/Mrp family chromosome partitioning ATPase